MKYRLLILILLLGMSWGVKAQTEIGVWTVINGAVQSDSMLDNQLGRDYFRVIYEILPNDLLDQYVVSLRLFTDGKDGELGGLNQMDSSVKYWQIDLDTADTNILSQDSMEVLDYTHTLIHEFGHLLTLNSTQIALTDDIYSKSSTDYDFAYLTSEGYAKENSYLDLFVSRYWGEDLLEEWDEIDDTRSSEDRLDLLYEFYLSCREQFVTDYAAESPEEDMAESWTFFVLSGRPQKHAIKYQKINFFYKFPELVAYREHIRSRVQFLPERYMKSF